MSKIGTNKNYYIADLAGRKVGLSKLTRGIFLRQQNSKNYHFTENPASLILFGEPQLYDDAKSLILI